MLTIKCAGCKERIYKYRKIGEGRVLYCYKERIVKDYSNHDVDKVLCKNCGKLIGIDVGNKIKMKQSSFISSGFIE